MEILRTIAFDGWSYPMYFLMRTFDMQVWVFYILVIFICGFFGFNLLVALLKTYFSMTASKYEEIKSKKVREDI